MTSPYIPLLKERDCGAEREGGNGEKENFQHLFNSPEIKIISSTLKLSF